jgi:secretion/DNA translocation related CpaE-like protein
VLVGSDAVTGPRLPRREGVHLVATPPYDSDVWRQAVEIGATSVLQLPREEHVVVRELTEAAEAFSSGATIAVVGARGGVGASSLALALGLTAVRRSVSSVVVDLDVRGGGLDLVVGAEDVDGLRWDDIGPVEGRLATTAFTGSLPRVHGLALLSCGRFGRALPASVDAVIDASRRAFAARILDVPRDGSADAAVMGADCAVIVVSADVRGCAAGHVVAASLSALVPRVRVAVRTGAGSSLQPDEVADAVGFPWVTAIADDPSARTAYERGDAPSLRRRGPWAQSCSAILDDVGVLDLASAVA